MATTPPARSAAARPPLLTLLIGLAAVYVTGRLILPAVAPREATVIWRLALGHPLFVLAAAGCFVRARAVRQDRLAWNLIGVGLLGYVGSSVAGDILGDGAHPSIAVHAGWFLFYACAGTALTLIGRRTLRPFPAGFLLDGILAFLAIAAGAILGLEATGARSFELWEVLAGLVYPTLDLVLLWFVLWLALAGRSRSRQPWTMLAAAFGLLSAADVLFVALAATDQLSEITANTIAYPVVAVMLAVAASHPPPPAVALQPGTARTFVSPAVSVAIALGALCAALAAGLNGPGAWLALATLVVALARGWLGLRELGLAQEGRRFERGFEEAGIGMAIVGESGTILRSNRQLADLLGLDRDLIVGTSILSHGAPTAPEALQRIREDIAAGTLRVDDIDALVDRADGTTFDAVASADLIPTENGELQVFMQLRDVSEQRRAQRFGQVVAGLARAAVVESNVDTLLHRLIADLTVALDAPLVAVAVQDSPVAEPAVMMSPGVFSPELVAAIAAGRGPVGAALQSGTPTRLARETTAADPELAPFAQAGLGPLLTVPVVPNAGPPAVICIGWPGTRDPVSDEEVRFVEAVGDVIASGLDRSRREAQSRYQALHDPLTGLANRALLTAHLDHVLAAARREHAQVGVVLLDLDRFKVVNDTLGHGVGDELLREVSARLTSHTRAGDLVARLGGDEFVVVYDAVGDVDELRPLAARLVEALGEPIQVGSRELYAGASVGIVVESAAAATPETLLRDADIAMYHAKEAGGGRYEVFDAALRARLVRRSGIENHLRHAVERGELRLALQPQVALDGRGLTGFEALVRWERPAHGLVAPGRFIPVAEETGLIGPLGAWVMREACNWLGQGPEHLTVSVNLSARQITRDLPGAILGAVERAGIGPDRLCLEITESLLITDTDAMEILDELRAGGVRLALDDFGTGWSSLSALGRHAVDELKLDRSMIVAAGTSDASTAIAQAAVDMAAALGLDVVAEGVESAEQLKLVRGLGCDLAQGFLFAPGLWRDEADRYVREERWVEPLAMLG